MSFYQQGPQLGNQYLDDDLLRSCLARRMPKEPLRQVEPDLERFGKRVLRDIQEWGDQAEQSPPRLQRYDAWGRRVDLLQVCEGWRRLDAVSAEEGLVAIGYERAQGPFSRLYQLAKLYLFNPSSSTYMCPLAMTDGAARLLEVHGQAPIKQRAIKHLTSRDPREFWTSGQWMTERRGGSDVGRSETVARALGEGKYALYGDKWFTSATTSQMAMTLARLEDAQGDVVQGSRGLSVFYLETRKGDGSYNGIQVNRLKDKLGTNGLPTAELTLHGTEAVLVGQPGAGVKTISTLFNVTRVYNAFAATSTLRRGFALASDYARRREAFGHKLVELPLHAETLADLYVSLAASLELSCEAALLQGRVETGAAEPGDDALLRLLTPLAKLFTAKASVWGCSEAVEAFGGAGYVENTGVARLLRDAQVLSIWEGTTNVLSLDALRALQREDAFAPFLERLRKGLEALDAPALEAPCERILQAVDGLEAFWAAAAQEGVAFAQAAARSFAQAMASTYAAVLLAERARWALADVGNDVDAGNDVGNDVGNEGGGGGRAKKDLALLGRWLQNHLTAPRHTDTTWREGTRTLLSSHSCTGP